MTHTSSSSSLLLCSFLFCLFVLGQCSSTKQKEEIEEKKPLNILGIAGISRSHSLAVFQLLEELSTIRSHNVTFLLPNNTDTKKWFPKEKETPNLHFVFDGDCEFEKWRPDPGLRTWAHTIRYFFTMAYTAKQFLEAITFPLATPTHTLITNQPQDRRFDVVVSSMVSLGAREAAHSEGVPVVSYVHAPLLLEIVCSDREHNVRLPSMASAVTQEEIKHHFGKRLYNQVMHLLLGSLFEYVFVPTLSGIIEKRCGPQQHTFDSLADILTGTWAGKHHMVLGGAPFSPPLPRGYNPHLHVMGVASKTTQKGEGVTGELGEWLDAVEERGGGVLYVSMGTVYVFSEKSISPLLAQLTSLLHHNPTISVLFSLPEKQQSLLHDHITPFLAAHPPTHLHISPFTPQPAVLAHPAVKIFLSHCGWGGMTDTMKAGKPVLAYPGQGDQVSNAVSVVQSGAGERLRLDFSDLESLVGGMLAQYSGYVGGVSAMREGLERYGGMEHAVRLVEEVGRGGDVVEDEGNREARERIDEYFVEDSQWEARLLAHCLVFSVVFLVFLVVFLLLVWLPWKVGRWVCCGGERKKKKE